MDEQSSQPPTPLSMVEGDNLSGQGRPSVFTSAIVDGLASGDALATATERFHFMNCMTI